MVLNDVLVGIRRPFLVRPANPVNAQLGQNVRSVVQGLGEVLDTAPDQDMERPWIVAPSTLYDPL